MEPSGFGNNEKQQRPIRGSASGRGVSNVKSVMCVCYMVMSVTCRIQPGGVSQFVRQNCRQDGPYIQASMTEVKSALRAAEVTTNVHL